MPSPTTRLPVPLRVLLALVLVAVALVATELRPAPATALGSSSAASGARGPAVPQRPSCPRPHGRSGPCTSRVFEPDGAARGVMIVIASGGWSSGPVTAPGSLWGPTARFWSRQGWRAVVVENTSGTVGGVGGHGPDGLTDLRQWYARIRAQTPARLPVCDFGQSSGGHFALLLGAVEPTLDCVVTEAAPTDLRDLPGPAGEKAAAAFGDRRERWRYSPARFPASTWHGRRILMGHMTADQVVPFAQVRGLHGGPGLEVVPVGPAGRCSAAQVDSDAVHHRFAHLCQQVGDDRPRLLDPSDADRWTARRARLARRVGVS